MATSSPETSQKA